MTDLFNIDRFMPHGHCFQWDPGILWSSVISDSLIALAYMAIPFTLVFQIMRKRKDLPFNWMFVFFGLFIVACGFTHVMDVVTIWRPYYPISAIIKCITAAASVPTAIILFRIAPKIVKLPSLQQLVHEQSLRFKAEAASEAKDRFIAALSHELRTPLTPVKAGLDLLEGELQELPGYISSPAIAGTFKMIRHNVEMEATLINDLLDVSAAAHGKLNLRFRLLDIKDILEPALAAFQQEIARKNITLKREMPTEEAVAQGEEIRLRQIISNLLSNALKFTPSDGRITVSLGTFDSEVRLSVHDTGPGIDAANLEKIFQPFEQGDRNLTQTSGGLGLGLTIAKALAESHGGRLSVESAGIGQGASFTLSLPRAENRADPVLPAPPGPTERRPHKLRILLVDDHPDTLQSVARLLRRIGYPVETAETMAAARQLFSAADVLITDIGLPDGDGCSLMVDFKAQRGGHGIAISGFGQEEDIMRSRRAGFIQHLTKPIDFDSLREALEALDQPG